MGTAISWAEPSLSRAFTTWSTTTGTSRKVVRASWRSYQATRSRESLKNLTMLRPTCVTWLDGFRDGLAELPPRTGSEETVIPTQGTKIAGWEGGLAPAQDPHPLNTELTAQAEELFRNFQANLSVEWVRTLSGGKPTFPTCDFRSLSGIPDAISYLRTVVLLRNSPYRLNMSLLRSETW